MYTQVGVQKDMQLSQQVGVRQASLLVRRRPGDGWRGPVGTSVVMGGGVLLVPGDG